ncbi:[FeFe] hydrogenase H-cluster radical SAM maturase HydE [Proteiniclasticum sp.]|uniref:[FeFe] hydrogenase H-cluster radical SAM maturase HydE n=1 Tax=Proteiniclasticum sp. TaxID=2053595 RepID=UPI0028A0C8BC|nr:[FeFe] hydrogenase H-cluster radical SAM maturase HydE [Proteiniclasticum sp.]
MTRNEMLIRKLSRDRILSLDEFTSLIDTFTSEELSFAQSLARDKREKIYGNKVYIRGLIELSSYCACDCLYCGIRRGNPNAKRYRLNMDEVLECCEKGHQLGFRTFVIQGGEDAFYDDEKLVELISIIKRRYPDCAVTLSLGERPEKSFRRLYEAGADRYLLRHETADEEHYRRLHPKGEELSRRMESLRQLKDIGFQVGTGFMVGSPYQDSLCLAKDMVFLSEFKPEMVGIGPFVPHHESVFRDYKSGSVDLTLFMLSLIRLMLPYALIPATTSLGTVDGEGREKGICSGANVVMPNLSPLAVRKKYMLYDNKAYTGTEAAESLSLLQASMERIGFEVVADRGDHPLIETRQMSDAK